MILQECLQAVLAVSKDGDWHCNDTVRFVRKCAGDASRNVQHLSFRLNALFLCSIQNATFKSDLEPKSASLTDRHPLFLNVIIDQHVPV